MEIPKKTLARWKSLKSRGDVQELAKALGKAEVTIHTIFSRGRATVKDAQIINAFYNKRRRDVRSIVGEDGN